MFFLLNVYCMLHKISRYHPYLIKLGERLYQLRTEKGLTQEQLNEMGEFDEGYIKFLEKGELNVGIRGLVIITQLLGISISDLFKDLD